MIAYLPLIILPTVVLFFRSALPPWVFMWLLAGSTFLACKWLSYWSLNPRSYSVPTWRTLAYFFAWPGMEPRAFLLGEKSSAVIKNSDWLLAAVKTILGAGLFWGIARLITPSHPLWIGWVGMLGIIFMLHFGSFHLLTLFWQSRGIPVQPLMKQPVLATSLSDFWGKRWNRDFRELSHRFVFKPLQTMIGVTGAGLMVFFLSGLIHDLVISLPARGGYGLPTLYFLIQGFGVVLERSTFGRSAGIDRGWRGWLFMTVCTAGPAYILFHPPFIHAVILPMMQDLKAY